MSGTAPAGAPAPAITDTSGSSVDSINSSIAKQQEILAMSLAANTAMAYLQAALGIAGKISGR